MVNRQQKGKAALLFQLHKQQQKCVASRRDGESLSDPLLGFTPLMYFAEEHSFRSNVVPISD